MEKCNILGVEIAVTNMMETVDYIEKNLEVLRGNYICISNVHNTVMAYEDKHYRNAINGGKFSLPDGKPLSIVQKEKGYKNATRVTGPDLMGEIFNISERKGYKHYFYGSTEDMLRVLSEKLKGKYPKLNIVGMYSPAFKENIEEENAKVLEQINNVQTDFLWVGLGAPKQEKWMFLHKGKVNSLMIGVGAGFDYYAEKIKRAPRWMQKYSLEWFYRLLQDPKRLLKRYVITNSKFIYFTKVNKKF